MSSPSLPLTRPSALAEEVAYTLEYQHRVAALHRLEIAFWLYIFLLIMEGSVRKWVPGLSGPFLLVRDPVALYIWFFGVTLGVGNKVAWLVFNLFACLVTTLGLCQIIAVPLPLAVFLYGWRSYVLHFPVIIVAVGLLDMNDLRKIAKWIMIVSIPMTILMVLQYLAPETAFINRGATEGGSQISGALGHIRPAGTFSFITGPSYFYPIVTAFICCGLAEEDLFPRWLLIASSIATLVAVPVSVSRTVALMVGLTICCALASLLLRSNKLIQPNQISKIALRGLIGIAIVVGVSQINVVKDALATFTVRWTSAGDASTVGTRVGDQLEDVLDPVVKTTPLGVGIGAGSTAAVALSGPNANVFKYGEDALSREVFELGSIVGTMFVLTRFAAALFCIFLASVALQRGNPWAWCLIPLLVTVLTGATLDQTTSQGFFVLAVTFSAIALK